MVYLLHFTEPYRHARHYLGSADDVAARIEAHTNGRGARLTQVCIEHGIGFDLVRTWQGGRDIERRLKRFKKATLLCPVCNPNAQRRMKI